MNESDHINGGSEVVRAPSFIFTPSADFSAVLMKAKQDAAEWWGALQFGKRERLIEWGGDNLAEMETSAAYTATCLDSDNVGVRRAAVLLVSERWFGAECFAASVTHMAFGDQDSLARGGAIAALLLLQPCVADPTGYLKRLLDALFSAAGASANIARSEQAHRWSAQSEQRRRNRWQQLAGADCAAMLTSRASAESYLAHADARLRIAAMLVIDSEWKPSLEFLNECRRLFFNDSDPEARAVAIALWSKYSKDSDDRHVGRAAAEIVRDESLPYDLRTSAYRALFKLRGLPVFNLLLSKDSAASFPNTVDWPFVKSFL